MINKHEHENEQVASFVVISCNVGLTSILAYDRVKNMAPDDI